MRSRTRRLERTRQLELLARLAGPASADPATVAEAMLASMGATLGAVANTFRLMDVAEQAIAERWPKLSKRETSLAFKYALACPTMPVRVSDLLVLAHLRELYARIPDDCRIDPRSGAIWQHLCQLTRAEVLGLLCEASLRHPLDHDTTFMYEHLFRQLFPGVDVGRDEVLDPFPNVGPRLERARRDAEEWLAKESPERAPLVRELRQELRAEVRS